MPVFPQYSRIASVISVMITLRFRKGAMKQRTKCTPSFFSSRNTVERWNSGGKKNDDDSDESKREGQPKQRSSSKKPRSSDSYRRTTPSDDEVTEENRYGIDSCPDCGESLCNLREAVRYLEDILLPALRGKTVEKQHIETGFCKHCRKWRSAIPIGKQITVLGENVQQRILHCIADLGMTFETTKRDLRSTFGIDVSDGEVVRILDKHAANLLPEYHDIDAKIRGSPAEHFDETSWPVQKGGEGNWGWVKTASDAAATIFRLGRSRGRGNAKALHSEQGKPAVTDDYGAYDFLGDDQALCWAHPKRKFKDLARSTSLSDKRRKHCAGFYERFCALLNDVKAVVESPYDEKEHTKAAEQFRERIALLCVPDHADPKKLATLKATFLERMEAYLLCVRLPHIPMTNNKAERALRPLVIKRKLSYGSKTQKGADVISILLSVCTTLRHQHPGNFYAAYREILRKWHPA